MLESASEKGTTKSFARELNFCHSSCQYYLTIQSSEKITVNLKLTPVKEVGGTFVRKDNSFSLTQKETYLFRVQSSDQIVLDVYTVSGRAALALQSSDYFQTYDIEEAGHYTVLIRPQDVQLGQYLAIKTSEPYRLRAQLTIS